MRVLLRLALLGLVVATAGPSRALADPTTSAPDPATVKLANQYVDAGLAAQDAHDYDTAITLYSRAYRLVQYPTLIFNLAQAYRLAGHADKALVLYRRYLAEDPEGVQASSARDFVAELGERAAAKLDARLVDAAPSPTSRASSPWKWVLGGSAGTAVGSFVFAWYANGRQNDAAQRLHSTVTSSDCGRSAASLGLTSDDKQTFDQACAWHSRTIVGEWVTVVALAASAVSLVMVLRDTGTPEPGATATRGTRHEIAIAPIVAPGTGGASLSVTW